MIRRWLPVLLLVSAFLSCQPGTEQSIVKLEKLTGNWVSDQNTILNFKWHKSTSGLAGVSYSVRQTDTLFLNRYEIINSHDSLFLMLSSTGRNSVIKRYHLESSWFGKYVFEADKNIYPYRITINLENDTLWQYQQENIRGNKVITFEFKPAKPI